MGVFADGSPGNILLIETQAPLAYAVAGDPIVAFRQANFSTEDMSTGSPVHGPHGSNAFADIDIRPGEGGTVTVLTPTTDQQLRLQTLTDLQPNPPWASSSLSLIDLSIQHHDCGVLGGAGQSERQSRGPARRDRSTYPGRDTHSVETGPKDNETISA